MADWESAPVVTPAQGQVPTATALDEQAGPPAWQAAPTDPNSPPPAQASAEPPDTIGRRLGLGTRDVIQGVAGPLYDLAAKPFQAIGLPVHSLEDNLTALGLPLPQSQSEKLASSVIQPAASVLPVVGAGRALSAVANPVIQTVGETLQQAPVTQAAAAGAQGGVTQYTESPTLGLVAGLATPFISGPGRVISPNIAGNISPERAAMVATAQREGIPLSPAQVTGGKVARNFESTLAQIPGSSGAMATANEAQNQAFTAAALRRAGIDSTVATPEVLNQGRSDLWNGIAAPIIQRNNLTVTPQTATDLQGLWTDVNRYADPSVSKPVLARIQDAIDGIVSNNGTMPGPAYQSMDSALSREIRSTSTGETRNYLQQLRGILRDAWNSSISPQDQEAWGDFKQKYANLKVIASAMDRPSEGTALGQLSPAALAQAGRNRAQQSFAFGIGDMDELSRMGQGILKQTVPDSGASQRTMMTNMLQGRSLYPALVAAAFTGNPLMLAAPAAEVGIPRLAAAGYNANWVRNYLMNDLVSGVPGLSRQNPLLPLPAIAAQGVVRRQAAEQQPGG